MSAAHRRHVCHLYRRALKLQLEWYVRRDLWYEEANKTRALFRQHMNETDPRTINRLIKATEARLYRMRHPDPYVAPESPGGSKWQRNTPVPLEIVENGWGEFGYEEKL